MHLTLRFIWTLLRSEWCQLFHRKHHVQGTHCGRTFTICQRCDTD